MGSAAPPVRDPYPNEFPIGSQRENQYTPMGGVYMIGDFAAGAARARGWKKVAAIAAVVLFVVLPIAHPLVVAVIVGLDRIFGG